MSKYPNSGSLFKNDRMREGKKDPNANGKATTTCAHCGEETEFWLDAWTKEGDKGRWQSLAFKPKDGQSKQPPAPPAPDFDDDLPF